MKKIELVLKEVLFQALENKNRKLTQAYLAKRLSLSLSVVNYALKPLAAMGAIKINTRSFIVLEPKKILYYWASRRNLKKDIIYSTRVELPVKKIEKELPGGVVFGIYLGYKFMFNDVPADYSEVYVYADDIKEIQRRFPKKQGKPENLFVLKKDDVIEYKKTGKIPQLFVDLWNTEEWYAKEFLKELEVRIDGLLE